MTARTEAEMMTRTWVQSSQASWSGDILSRSVSEVPTSDAVDGLGFKQIEHADASLVNLYILHKVVLLYRQSN